MSEGKVNQKEKSTEVNQTAMSKIRGVYHLKPVRKTWLSTLDEKHDGAIMLSKTFSSLCPDIDYSTGIIKTGLTPELETELEIAMNLTKGTLSPYNKAFWSDFKRVNTRVPKEGLVIDCDRSATDKLRYCYLKVSSKVATSMADVTENGTYDFVLMSASTEAKQTSSKFAVKQKAFKILGDMSIDDQIDFLLVYKQGKYKVSKGATAEFISEGMATVIEENPAEFVELMENPSFKDFVFLRKCIVAGLLRMKGATYITLGGDIIGNSFEEAIFNLQKPEFNSVKVSLLAKLENK